MIVSPTRASPTLKFHQPPGPPPSHGSGAKHTHTTLDDLRPRHSPHLRLRRPRYRRRRKQPGRSRLSRLATGRAAVTNGQVECSAVYYLLYIISAALSVAKEEVALHLKLCIFKLIARATSEITKDIHVQSRACRMLRRYVSAATGRFKHFWVQQRWPWGFRRCSGAASSQPRRLRLALQVVPHRPDSTSRSPPLLRVPGPGRGGADNFIDAELA